jgi:hypothetical protein
MRRKRLDRTEEICYMYPILSALVALGGRGKKSDVERILRRTMRHVLSNDDHDHVDSGPTRIAVGMSFAATKLRVKGWIRPHEACNRGEWVITQEGRHRIQLHEESMAELFETIDLDSI